MEFFDPKFILQTLGLLGVFIVIFAESGTLLGLFFPGDSLLFLAGVFASQGHFSIVLLVIGAMVAAILGDSVGYLFGKKIGPKIFTKEDSFFFKKSHITKTEIFYKKHGNRTIAVARFIPIVRTFAPILAGVGDMPYDSFLRWNILGGVVWATLFCFGGYFIGSVLPAGQNYLTWITITIIAVSLIPAGYQILRYSK